MNRTNIRAKSKKITLAAFAVLIFTLSAFSQDANGATVTAVQSGNWNDPTTWNTVAVPLPTDSVTIPTGLTVNNAGGTINNNRVGNIYNAGTITNIGTINNNGVINKRR